MFVRVCMCVCVYMSPGDKVCKMNNCRQEKLFLSHRDCHREHIVPSSNLFLGSWTAHATHILNHSHRHDNIILFCFFIPSYFLTLAANTYSYIMLFLIIVTFSFLVHEIKSFPNSYKSLCI